MYYDYSYSYSDGELLGVIIFYVVYMLFAGGLSIGLYVLRSLGVYTIAKNRGLKRPWFAWLPVTDHYLLGCISDQYRYVVKGQNKSKRKILLVLDIACAAFGVAAVVVLISLMFRLFGYGMIAQDAFAQTAAGMVLCLSGVALPWSGVAVAKAVFRYMALYDVYVSCDPKNSTMYTVLSILFSVTEPFFLFFNRKKDEGMPPRREPEPPVWEAPKAEEPWANE